ncbi:MAG: hypothetical protein ACKPGN_23160 [Dolichospermum sp.]
MAQQVSILAKEFIDGFRAKVDLDKLDTIEVYDSQKQDLLNHALTGVYGWGDDSERDEIFGHSIVWKKGSHYITDVMTEIKNQLQNEYTGKIELIMDGMRLVLKRIKE